MKNKLLLLLLLICSLNLFSEKIVLKNERIEVTCEEQDLAFAQNIIDVLPNMIDDFQVSIGSYPDFVAKIYLSHDREDFQRLTNHFSGITEFSNAFYSNRNKQIYIKSYFEIENNQQFHTILLHEYIHAFIDYYLKDAPLWFHEGMAVYFSRQYSLQMSINLGLDYLSGDVRDISKMERDYPFNSLNLSSFYAKSAQAVKFLYEENKNEFSNLFNKKAHFNSAFTTTFKTTRMIFYKDFEKSFKRKIILNTGYGIFSALWALLPIVLLLGWHRQSKKRQKEIDEMPDEDEVKII